MWLISWLIDALELLPVHHREESGGGRDRGPIRADAGGKRVGRRIIDHIHRRLGQAGADGHLLHHVVELPVLLAVRRVRARHREHHAVAHVYA